MLNVYLRCLHELIVEKENCENAVVCIIVLGTIYVLIVFQEYQGLHTTRSSSCSFL